MELTGKCKEDFNNWYLDSAGRKTDGMNKMLLDFFWDSHSDSMQFGVIQDFGSSKGYFLEINRAFLKGYESSSKLWRALDRSKGGWDVECVKNIGNNKTIAQSRLDVVQEFDLAYNSAMANSPV